MEEEKVENDNALESVYEQLQDGVKLDIESIYSSVRTISPHFKLMLKKQLDMAKGSPVTIQRMPSLFQPPPGDPPSCPCLNESTAGSTPSSSEAPTRSNRTSETSAIAVEELSGSTELSQPSAFLRPEDIDVPFPPFAQVALIHLVDIFSRNNAKFLLIQPAPSGKMKKDTNNSSSTSSSGSSRDKVFGIPLETLLKRDVKMHPNAGLKIPIIFAQMLQQICQHGLREEGVLRKSASQTLLKRVIQSVEQQPDGHLPVWDPEWGTVEMVGLLKHFLKSLPEPLFTNKYVHAMESIADIPRRQDRLQALQDIVLLLPEVNRNCLKALLHFYGQVVSHRDENRMSTEAVVRLMWPNLCELHWQHFTMNEIPSASSSSLATNHSNFVKDDSSPNPPINGNADITSMSLNNSTTSLSHLAVPPFGSELVSKDTLQKRWDLMGMLLEHVLDIWKVPVPMVDNIRAVLREEKEKKALEQQQQGMKDKKKATSNKPGHVELIAKKKTVKSPAQPVQWTRWYHPEASTTKSSIQAPTKQRITIRVRSPKLSKSSETYDVEPNTTAAMVVQAFVNSKKRHTRHTIPDYLEALEKFGRLYEVYETNGNSLGELCLHPDTVLYPLCQTSSSSDTPEWIVKPNPDYYFLYRPYPQNADDQSPVNPLSFDVISWT